MNTPFNWSCKLKKGAQYPKQALSEAITWFNSLDDTFRQLINNVISSANDLHSTLLDELKITEGVYSKGIANEELIHLVLQSGI